MAPRKVVACTDPDVPPRKRLSAKATKAIKRAPAKAAPAKRAPAKKTTTTKVTEPEPKWESVPRPDENGNEVSNGGHVSKKPQSSSATTQWERVEIPRHPRWNGPLVMPPDHELRPGERKCKGHKESGWESCGRKWHTNRCTCQYYKRTTNFIDVLQDEYKLKEWDRRLTATGMAENPELVLSALALRPDRDVQQTPEEKQQLQQIANKAKEYAKGSAAASIGTSLHTFTQWMDEGKELGFVPEPYPADLEAYRLATKDIEWTNIESFRVYDDWKVGGTTDRIGWYRGRLTIFDIKTGKLFFKAGPAMQLAMYARSTRYDIATDTRLPDVDELRLDVGYVIHLPAGSGKCELLPVNIGNGWQACRLAKAVWDIRSRPDEDWFPDRDGYAEAYEGALTAYNLNECKMRWAAAQENGHLDSHLKKALTERANWLKAEGLSDRSGLNYKRDNTTDDEGF